MRYLTILLILILGVDVKAQKLTLYTYDDKQLHMGATYVISSFTTAYVFKKTQNVTTNIFGFACIKNA